MRILEEHCSAVGRDPLEIERTMVRFVVLRDDPAEAARVLGESLANNGSDHVIDPQLDFLGDEERIAAQWRRYLELGFTHLIADFASPFDAETMERLPRLREMRRGRLRPGWRVPGQSPRAAAMMAPASSMMRSRWASPLNDSA